MKNFTILLLCKGFIEIKGNGLLRYDQLAIEKRFVHCNYLL